MNKILSSLLTLSLLLAVATLFAGCGIGLGENEPSKNVFYCYSNGDEFSMTLPAEFRELTTSCILAAVT